MTKRPSGSQKGANEDLGIMGSDVESRKVAADRGLLIS